MGIGGPTDDGVAALPESCLLPTTLFGKSNFSISLSISWSVAEKRSLPVLGS